MVVKYRTFHSNGYQLHFREFSLSDSLPNSWLKMCDINAACKTDVLGMSLPSVRPGLNPGLHQKQRQTLQFAVRCIYLSYNVHTSLHMFIPFLHQIKSAHFAG